jgi:hypothetical protein
MKTFVSILLLIASLSLRGEEKVITLKNGQQYGVRTSFGSPVHHANEYLDIRGILPSVDQVSGWRKAFYFWRFEIAFIKEIQGSMSIDSPLNPRYHSLVSLDPHENSQFHRVLMCEFMERDDIPEVWEWVNEPGVSWVPFHFKITSASLPVPLEFMDWAKLTEDDKVKIRKDFKKISDLESDYKAKEIKLMSGDKQTIKVLDGLPARFANRYLQIDALSVVKATSAAGKPVLVYVVTGRYGGWVETTVEIAVPSIDKTFRHAFKLKRQGPFAVPFVVSDTNPAFWAWPEAVPDFWIPVEFTIQKKDAEVPTTFTEWLNIDKNIRARLAEFQKQGRQP